MLQTTTLDWNTVEFLIRVMLLHFVADFVCQPRVIGENKHKNAWLLLLHVGIYGLVLLTSLPLLLVLWNAVTHLFIDFLSSKLSHHLYEKEEHYWFWLVIGFDQFLHLTWLFLTVKWYMIVISGG